jgi:glucosamine--fructose-6-phosphate aminotransferase (isomerizing)
VKAAMCLVMKMLEGANVILVLCVDFPDQLFAIKKQGTLLLGRNSEGSFVSSDPLALEPIGIESNIILGENEIAIVRAEGWEIINPKKERPEEATSEEEGTNGFSYYMEKEIFEQSESLARAVSGRLITGEGLPQLGGIRDIARSLRKVETFHFVGCGTAYHSCLYAAMLFNRFGMRSRAWIASEFCYNHPVFSASDAFIFLSQSGETADTIEVLEEIKIKGNICLGIVNVASSRIARDTDAGVMIRAGQERGVASTKAFTSQLMVIAMLAIYLGRQRSMTIDTGQKIIRELELLSGKVKQALEGAAAIEALAEKYKGFRSWYFLGRGFNNITAQEGALKLMEISYIHAQAYPLGEMKHGPLALVDQNFPSLVIIPRDPLLSMSLVNIREIKGRGGKVIAVTNPGVDLAGLADDRIDVPETLDFLSPLITTIPTQLLAYYTAVRLGRNPDKPRNLAKSVTVK